jgi:hypothetical protein
VNHAIANADDIQAYMTTPVPSCARRLPPTSQRRRTRLFAIVPTLALAMLLTGARARAFDPATTHAGLTQQAAIASVLHQVLAKRLGRPLGIFEPVALHPETIPLDQRRLLMARLGALDPAGGYRPADDGVAPAIAFVVAGSVIAKAPPERIQNMFFDPSTGSGLRDDAALDGFLHSVRLIADAGGSFRGAATGSSFSLEGESSLKWLDSPHNDVGLPTFYSELERAIADSDPARRSSALAQALLALGGVLSVLEDAGNPAQVRNDFRASYLHGAAGGPFNKTSAFERTVADLYGQGGVPAPRAVVRRPDLRSYFTGSDGQGLADRTQRRFFSVGTIPEDGVVDHDTTTADVVKEASKSMTYALPAVGHLDLRQMGVRRYVTASDGAGTPSRRILGYERVPGRVRFFLDAPVYADSARALLPEIAGYAAGLIDHLLRAQVTLAREGDLVRATVVAPAGRIQSGRLRLFAEDGTGKRKEIGSFDGAGTDSVSVTVPGGTRRLAAVLNGRDAAGPVVGFGELAVAPERR